jgi:ribose transport system substrate-binding protein
MSDGLHIAVFTKNRSNPAYEAARIGADRTASRLGGHTTHFVPRAPDDGAEQVALIDAALVQRPDGFVFVPVHETAVNDAVRRIDASGIPLANIINRMSVGNRITFVGSDDIALALAVAGRLIEHLGGRGAIAIMEGTSGSVTSKARLAGFRQAAARFAEIRILTVGAANYQHDDARWLMEEWLGAYPRIDGLLCANDVMALGAIEAMHAAGRMMPVVGVNALPEAIEALKEGTLLATADFDALKMACVATEAIIRHLRGETVPEQIMLPVQVVDRENCAPWDRPLAERECPRWDDAVKTTSDPDRDLRSD